MKKTKIPRKKVRGKNMKRLFACLLSLSMIPANGVAVFAVQKETGVASTQKSAGVKTQAEDTKESSVKFAQDSLKLKIGHFNKYHFEGIKATDIASVSFSFYEPGNGLGIYWQTYDWEDNDNFGTFYIPYGIKAGRWNMGAEIRTVSGEHIQVPKTIIEVEDAEEGVVPIGEFDIYGAIREELKSKGDCITISDMKKLKKLDISYRNIENIQGMEYATNCTRLDLSNNQYLEDISPLNTLKKLKIVNLSNTAVKDIDHLKEIKNQLTELNLSNTNVSIKDRFDCFKDQTIEIEEGAEKEVAIQPKGILEKADNCKISGDDIKITKESNGCVIVNATNAKAGDKATLTITNDNGPDAKITIPVSVTDASSEKPEFAQDSVSVNIGEFKEVSLKNVNDDIKVTFNPKDDTLVRVVDENGFYYEPRNNGTTQIEAQFKTKDGTIYRDSIDVIVNESEKNVVPIKSWNIYTWLRDEKDDYVDQNGDHKITTNEIKNVKSLSLSDGYNRYNLVDEDLEGLEQAVNCKEINVFECKGLTFAGVQNLIKKLPNLKKVELQNLKITQEEIDQFVTEKSVKNLEELDFYNCEGFETINVSELLNLNSLSLGLSKIKEIQGLDKLTGLKNLSLRHMDQLNDFSKIKNLEQLEKLDLYETNIDSIEPVKDLKNIKELNLSGTKITAKDRLSLIRTKKIELEEGENRLHSIYPIGIIDWNDKLVLDSNDSEISKYNSFSNDGLKAEKGSAGATGTLKIINDGKTYAEIPVSVTAEKEETPGFAKKEETISIGYTGPVKLKNTDNLDDIWFNVLDESGNDREDILGIEYDNASDQYNFVPKKTGEVLVTGKFIVEDGQSYERTMKVTVKSLPDGYLPISNRDIYNALTDSKGNAVDVNKDYMIDTDEIKNVSIIKGHYCGIEDKDFDYLKKAVNCEKMDISDNKALTDLSFISSFPKLKEINLENDEKITDFKDLIAHKEQFDSIILPAQAPDSVRKDLINTENISLKEGKTVTEAVQPAGLLKDTDKVSVKDSNIAEAKIIPQYDEDEDVIGSKLEVTGKSAGTTTLTLEMGSETKEIAVTVNKNTDAKMEFADASKNVKTAQFKSYTFKNVDASDIKQVKFTYDKDDVLKIVSNADHSYTPVALKDHGTVKVSAEITLKNGLKETVGEQEFTVVPADESAVIIKDYDLYKGMKSNGASADADKDGIISKNEIKNVDDIEVINSSIEDLTGVEQAVNCKKADFSNDAMLKDIMSLAKLTNLTSVNLRDTSVSDITALKGLTKLDFVCLDDSNVNENDKIDLLRLENISLTEGESTTQEIKPNGLLGKDVDVIVGFNIATAKIGEGKLVVTGKSAGQTTLEIGNKDQKARKKITISVTAKATEAPAEPTKPEDPKPEAPKPTPTQPTTAAPQKVAKITVTAPSNKLSAGKKVKLTANISNNASNKNIKWTTSNKKYATVDKNGVVKFNKKAAGKTVTITAYATDGSGKKATFKIKIMKGTVKKIKITGKKMVKAGKTLSLKAKVTASKGANKKLKWTSSNTKYATVSRSGKVKALKAGKKKSVKITAMATDGSGKKATITIKIK